MAEKFGLFAECWGPKAVAELNAQQVNLARFLGAFPGHRHEAEPFLLVRGRFRTEFRDLLVVSRGVEHRPVAEEAHVLLIEPVATLDTGNTRDERTVDRPERI